MKNKAIRAFLLTAFFALTSAVRADLTVIQSEKSQKYRSIEIEREQYLTINALAEIMNGQIEWEPLLKKATLVIGEHRLVISLFSRYVLVDNKLENLFVEPRFREGTFWIPIRYLVPILQSIRPENVVWNQKEKTLSIATGTYNIVDLKALEKLNGTLLEITTTQPLQFETFLSDELWLTLNIYQGKLNPRELSKKNVGRYVNEIKAYQFDNAAQISFHLSKPFLQYRESWASDPDRIQISLEDTTVTVDTVTAYIPPLNGQEPVIISPEPNPIDVVVVDAGHGGEDTGAIGPKRTKEKDVVLSIAKKVARKLEQDGRFKVIMTRKVDVFIPLGERTKIANDSGADLFVSIHANANRRRIISGVTTYFLDVARNDEARAVAQAENASFRFEKKDTTLAHMDDLRFILLDMVQNAHQKESEDLAWMIQGELRKRLDIPDRGVDQAGFFVLNYAYMPGVLVETAFISNKKEEELLKKDKFQEKVAEGIYQAITQFKQKYEKLSVRESNNPKP